MPSNEGPVRPATPVHETEVLVVGGGPVGMVAAYRLAQLGQASMVIERATITTVHPKMEFTSCRSMEIYRRMGVADRLRALAVPEHYSFNEINTTGFGRTDGELATVERPSPVVLRERYLKENDGSHPQEPYMRMSQIIFESWLKPLCQAEPLIDDRWGYCFKGLVEYEDHVLTTVTDEWGRDMVIKSKYVLGCDGGGSQVRAAAGLEAKRHPIPMNMLMIHFKSRDLRSKGQFWHANIMSGAVVVSQDEISTYTVHQMVPPETDVSAIDARARLSDILGGIDGACSIEIDEILIKSSWKTELAVANRFRSEKGRVLLAGDAAHQLSPAGGNGLNSGVADVYDLSWKLAAVLKGFGGEALLVSHDLERRPVALKNTERVEEAITQYFLPLLGYAGSVGSEVIHAATPEGEAARAKLRVLIQSGHWVHAQEGTWLDYRYTDSPVVAKDPSEPEPARQLLKYIPSTYPGLRAPHVYLQDGRTSIFDLYGPDFTLVDFTVGGEISDLFLSVARGMHVPVRRVRLHDETHARTIWGRDAVLVRPDGHVAWRAPPDGVDGLTIAVVKEALGIATGRISAAPPKGINADAVKTEIIVPQIEAHTDVTVKENLKSLERTLVEEVLESRSLPGHVN